MLFDYQQNLRHIIGQGTPAAECGSVSALAISADHTTVAAGHTNGFIFTWDLNSSGKPFLIIPPIPRKQLANRTGDGHISDQAVLHVGFLGTRHTALVSADESGMAFSHLATRGLGAVGRTVKTTRLLGRYPDAVASVQPSTVLAFAPLPLGNIVQSTDDVGLTALLTPYLLVIVSTTPVAQTQFKTARTKETAAHGAMTGCLAWFPAVKLKTATESSPVKVAKTKLAYCWSNILSVLEVESEEVSEDDDSKRPPLHFHVRRHWKGGEAIVAVQWISRSVIALLTITQRLVILEDQAMNLTDTSDLNPRHIYHRDLFSRQLEPLVSKADQEDKTMHGVVPDAYSMSFKAYKSRLFLLDSGDISMGTLSNWADRLVALMEAGRLIEAIELATIYYNGSADKVTVGLPEEDSARHPMVRERLLQMIAAALRYTFKMDESDELGKDLTTALQELVEPIFTACVEMDEITFLFGEVYEWYSDASCQDSFLQALEPRIIRQQVTSVPTEALKDMMNWYVSLGMAQRLQEMLVSLDTATLDIDQVTSLCKQLNLIDAFIYVWNQAVEDYITPLAELIRIAEEVVHGEEDEGVESEEYLSAMKMFPYMAYVMTGRVYPEGSEMNIVDAETAQTAIYGYLFASTRYAPLRAILSFSTAEFMSILNEAFEDPYLNGKPVNDSSDDEDNALERTSFSINRLRIVHTLLDILASDDYDLDDRIYLNMFIARNLPKYPQYIMLPGRTLQQILTELCNPPNPDLASECQLSIEYLLSVYRPSDIHSLISLFEQARFYRVLKATYKTERQISKWLKTYFADRDEPHAVFDAIADCFRPSTGLTQRQMRDIKSIITDHSKQLAEINVVRSAATLQSSAPDLLAPVYENLADAEQARYFFLKTLLEPANEPATPTQSEAVIFIESHRTEYIQLMCHFDPAHVTGYITTIESSSLHLESLLPVLERTGVIDAAVVLMVNDGLQREAMDRLVGHLQSLQTALTGTARTGSISALNDLVAEVEKYNKLGIWLCQPYSSSSSKATQEPLASHIKLQPADLSDTNLTPPERLWLELTTTIVDTSLAFSSIVSSAADAAVKDADAHIRLGVHDAFTALLSATSSQSPPPPPSTTNVHPSAPRLLPVLRLFLSHLSATTNSASSTPQSSASTLLPILNSIFSAHAFSASLLSLSYKLLAKDTFTQYETVVRARHRGWRPSGRACARCGDRVWGVGAGVGVWDDWARRREAGKEGSAVGSRSQGKGKSKKVSDEQAESRRQGNEREKDKLGARVQGQDGILSFACGHLYHQQCLEGGMRERGWTWKANNKSREAWRCLSCD